MKETLAINLRQLVFRRSVAALGTLHSGAPYVSMVPFAVIPDGTALVLHVSALAAHTKDMLADARVSILILGADESGVQPQALPRVTIVGEAQQLPAGSPEHSVARQAYLMRFPDSAPIFELGDFSLFTVTVTAARWIGGFGDARSITPGSFAKMVRAAG